VRYNASTRSHAELDEAADLDEGDIGLLAARHRQLAGDLPALAIVGGCCGTDARHVDALWT
jgi:homocysteine S-methyltransferase